MAVRTLQLRCETTVAGPSLDAARERGVALADHLRARLTAIPLVVGQPSVRTSDIDAVTEEAREQAAPEPEAAAEQQADDKAVGDETGADEPGGASKPVALDQVHLVNVRVEIPGALRIDEARLRQQEFLSERLADHARILGQQPGVESSRTQVAIAAGDQQVRRVTFKIDAYIDDYSDPDDHEPVARWSEQVAFALSEAPATASQLSIESWPSGPHRRNVAFSAQVELGEGPSAPTEDEIRASDAAIERTGEALAEQLRSVDGVREVIASAGA